jgi:hypothetical protein
MSDDSVEAAKRFRARAEKLRTIADDTTDARAKKALLDGAADYEQMARERERKVQTS